MSLLLTAAMTTNTKVAKMLKEESHTQFIGGHIKDAINITNPSVLEQVFFLDPRLMYKAAYIRDLKRGLASVLLQQNEMAENFFQIYKNEPLLSEPPIIIFHCEFSMERGPRMYNYLRKLDREYNKKHYPYLAYPEIYLLGDGYSNFIKGFDVSSIYLTSTKFCFL